MKNNFEKEQSQRIKTTWLQESLHIFSNEDSVVLTAIKEDKDINGIE